MKLDEVVAPQKTPEFLKTVGQETSDRQYQIFMDDNIAKIANELDRQIKAGNVTVNPSATTQPQQAQPQSAPQSSVQPQTPAGETPEQKRIRVQKASQQNIDKTATPIVPTATTRTPDQIRQQKQAQATQTARAVMTDKPPIKPAVWRSNRTESVKFEKLNSLFENIINIDEAVQQMHISDYITQLFKNTMNSPIFDDPALSTELQALADEVEKTYSVDKGRAAISELVNFGFTEFAKYQVNKKMSRTSTTSKTSASTTPPAVTSAPTSNFGINPDGSITVAGAKGKDAGKILPGDPLYPKFVAYINKQLST